MKIILEICLFFIFLSSCAQKNLYQKTKKSPPKKQIVIIQNFEKGTFAGGGWEEFMNDKVRTFKTEITDFEKLGEKGHSFAIEFDFQKGADSVGGLWLDVSNYDFNKYKYFGFWVKGEPKLGYPKIVGITFESDNNKRDTKFFGRVSDKWQKVEIPISELNLPKPLKIKEINIFIDRRYIGRKVGRIYLDNLFLR